MKEISDFITTATNHYEFMGEALNFIEALAIRYEETNRPDMVRELVQFAYDYMGLEAKNENS